MKTKLLNKLWIDWNKTNKDQRFGQYVMSETVVEHHLTSDDRTELWNCSNPMDAYNKVLMLCED